jgi:hypothetical protein
MHNNNKWNPINAWLIFIPFINKFIIKHFLTIRLSIHEERERERDGVQVKFENFNSKFVYKEKKKKKKRSLRQGIRERESSLFCACDGDSPFASIAVSPQTFLASHLCSSS